MQEPVVIDGLVLRTEGNRIIVEVEIQNKRYPVIEDVAFVVEGVISHGVNPINIRRSIETGIPSRA